MASYQHIQTLYSSSMVNVIDVCCRPDCSACGEEKHASRHLLVLPRAGISVRHRSRREAIVFDPTCALFLNAGEASRFSHPVPGGDDYTVLAFGENALGSFLRADDPAAEDRPAGKWFPRPVAAASAQSALLLQRWRQHLQLGPRAFDPLVVEETAASLLVHSLRTAGALSDEGRRRLDTRRAHRELAHRARYLLAARFPQRVTLDDLAREVFSSPFHLARVFRREMGSSLHGYVLRLRLRAALERLTDDPGPDLTMLALDLGFSSHAHFSAAFRQAFEISPSGLRRRASGHLLNELRQRLPETAS